MEEIAPEYDVVVLGTGMTAAQSLYPTIIDFGSQA